MGPAAGPGRPAVAPVAWRSDLHPLLVTVQGPNSEDDCLRQKPTLLVHSFTLRSKALVYARARVSWRISQTYSMTNNGTLHRSLTSFERFATTPQLLIDQPETRPEAGEPLTNTPFVSLLTSSVCVRTSVHWSLDQHKDVYEETGRVHRPKASTMCRSRARKSPRLLRWEHRTHWTHRAHLPLPDLSCTTFSEPFARQLGSQP